MFCSKCGTECRADQTACPKCGAPLTVPVTLVAPPKKKGIPEAVWIVVGILGGILMVGLLLLALSRARSAAQDIKCASNLKQLALCVAIYANDNGDMLPNGDRINWNEVVCSCEMSPKILDCPAGTERAGGNDYVFLGNGMDISRVDDPEKLPLFLCRAPHRNGVCPVAFFDGHVESVELPPNLSCEAIVRRLSPDAPEQVLENARAADADDGGAR